MLEFAGAAVPLSDADITTAASQLGVEPAVIAAVAEVESSGAGFLPDGRPKILFERHIFSRETDGEFDGSNGDISNPKPGGYGAAGAHQYDRLHRAIALDREAALRSASWGKFQCMGFNAKICGWADVEPFVVSMAQSEAQHLKAFIGFCRGNNLLRHLVSHNWRLFTIGYNGTGQVEHYSWLLGAAYEKHAAVDAAVSSAPPAPPARVAIDTIRAVQFSLGVTPDGVFGSRSRRALNALLTAAGQPGI